MRRLVEQAIEGKKPWEDGSCEAYDFCVLCVATVVLVLLSLKHTYASRCSAAELAVVGS
jgi:hypothetical protein